jgi:hypothetical protein
MDSIHRVDPRPRASAQAGGPIDNIIAGLRPDITVARSAQKAELSRLTTLTYEIHPWYKGQNDDHLH